jgi:hypothetical protein
LKYHAQKDFVIDLDNVWKWLDFSYKHKAKLLLKKITKFCSTQRLSKKETRGGHNKEIIMLNNKRIRFQI